MRAARPGTTGVVAVEGADRERRGHQFGEAQEVELDGLAGINRVYAVDWGSFSRKRAADQW